MQDGAGPDGAQLHAPFRPRRGPAVARAVGVAALALGVGLAVAVPGVTWGDRLGFCAVGVALAAFMQRQAGVRAVPSAEGLLVRNLLERRQVAWSEIEDLRFGGGRPWVQLELSDGESLAVMAVQRADGPYADREARRLATLVALHRRPPQDPAAAT